MQGQEDSPEFLERVREVMHLHHYSIHFMRVYQARMTPNQRVADSRQVTP